MTTPDTEPNTREGLFRFGQKFVNKNIQFKYYRDIMTRLICVDIIDEAFNDGVILTKKGENGKKTEDPVEWFDEWKKESDKHWKEQLNSYYLERRNGQALTQWIVANNKLKLYSFCEDDYEPEYNDLTSELIGGKSFLKIVNIPKTKTLTFGKIAKSEEIPHSKIEQVQEIMTRRKELVNEGLSMLEPAWDVLTAIYMLMSHSAYYVAKAGAGLMKAKIPASEITGGASVDAFAREANEFGSSQGVIVEVTHLDGEPEKKYEVEYITVQSSVQWMELFKMYLIELSILTGIPVSMLEGITPGQLEGALVNESDKFDALEDIQQVYEVHTRHYCEFIADFLGKTEEFDIGYNVRRDQTKQLIEALKAFKELSGRTIKPDKVANLLGLELTEEDLEEKQEMPIMVPGQDPLAPTNGEPKEPIVQEPDTDG